MNENELISASGEEVVNDSYDYISAINEMKKNTVSRESYEKLVKERDQLADAVINGSGYVAEQPTETVDIQELRNSLFSSEACDKGMSNMEFTQRALALRNALIAAGEVDPFLPVSRSFAPTTEDREQAELAATVYQECLDIANGDASVFQTELMRRTADVRMPSARQNTPYRR